MSKTIGYLIVLPALFCATVALAGAQRPYVAGNFHLALDGVSCGFVRSVEGGGITAAVVEERMGPDNLKKKHLGGIEYEEVTIQLPVAMPKPVYDWIVTSLRMGARRTNVTITACDYEMDAKSATDYLECLISEVGFPACDVAAKDPAYITLKFKPETSRVNPKASGKMGGDAGKTQTQQRWLPANFQLTINGLDTSKVNSIQSFVIKQAAVAQQAGESRIQANEPGTLEFPNLIVTFSEASADTWSKWHADFVVNGNNGEPNEKSGTLALLSPNRKSELLKLTFHNLGIFRLVPDKVDAGSEQIKRVRAEMYCERIEMQPQPAGVGKDVDEGDDTGKEVAPAE